MNSRIYRVGIVLLGVSLVSASSPAVQPKDIGTLLPSARQAESWTSPDEPVLYQGDDLFMFINGGAELYHQYGFVRVISQDYERGDDSIVCNIYQMEDPEAAFGIFSYSRNPDRTAVSVGDGGYASSLQLAFWQDRYYVVVESFVPGEELEKVRMSFAKYISDNIGDHAEPPPLLQKLPQSGLIPGSEKLLRGKITLDSLLFLGKADPFQLERADRVLYGEYEVTGGKAKLFWVVYQDEAKAGRVYPRVKELLSSGKGYSLVSEQGTESRFVKEDRFYLLRQAADHIVLVADAPSLDEAAKITGEN